MLNSTLLILAMTVGQAGEDVLDKHEYDPHLEPLAWMIGEWEAQTLTGTGELKHIIKDKYSWTADKQAIVLDLTSDRADGTRQFAGHVIFYWDSAEKRLALHGVFSGGVIETAGLVKSDDNSFTWADRMVYSSGNQGHYRLKISHEEGSDSFTRGWSKISGSGASELGPYEFKSIK